MAQSAVRVRVRVSALAVCLALLALTGCVQTRPVERGADAGQAQTSGAEGKTVSGMAALEPEQKSRSKLAAKLFKKGAEPPRAKRDSHQCYSLRRGHKGRCEPQSLPYGRCRSGIWCCQGNIELSPVNWYECEARIGHTSAIPADGCILILGDNSRHRMTTGHVFYVEKAHHTGGNHYQLSLSHTNYDRKCSIETNVLADYDASAKTLTMRTGHWSAWGKNLKVSGCILR